VIAQILQRKSGVIISGRHIQGFEYGMKKICHLNCWPI
jgi:hypothetical protein